MRNLILIVVLLIGMIGPTQAQYSNGSLKVNSTTIEQSDGGYQVNTEVTKSKAIDLLCSAINSRQDSNITDESGTVIIKVVYSMDTYTVYDEQINELLVTTRVSDVRSTCKKHLKSTWQ